MTPSTEPAEPEPRRAVAGRSIRWDEAQAARAYADGWWTHRTLGDALTEAAAATPSRVLLKDGDVSIDCARLHRDANALARALLSRAPPGSVVSFMLPNWHEAATIYLAATLAGMVAHPILPSLRARDLSFMLADVDSRIIFIPGTLRGHDYPAMLREVCAGLPAPPHVIVVRGDGKEDEGLIPYAALDGPPDMPLPALDADAVRMILYTSGTTGAPKGVMHSHNSIHALVRQLGEHWLVAPGDVFLVPSPVSHIGGSIYAFELPLLLGTTAVLMERWDADAALTLMVRERVSHIAGATPFLDSVLTAARQRDEHLPALKLFVCGGAAVPPALIRDAAAWFDGAVVTRVYGSTEVPVISIGTIDRADVDHAAETDGRPGAATVRLSDSSEIMARGPQMLLGYLHTVDEAGLFQDGFYRTGDLGRLTEEGFLVVTGRVKDIIIRNGENISPKEIEDALATHPGIAEVSIVGIPDARTGERACAVIVPAAGAAPTLDEITTLLRSAGFAAFKWPERVEHWEALPRNPTGKVLKHVIRARLIAQEGR